MALFRRNVPVKESRTRQISLTTYKSGFRKTIYSPNGDSYTGEWLKNKKHGTGTQMWNRKKLMYEGSWEQNMRSGFGTLYRLQPATRKFLRVYSGMWKDDKKDGYGTYFYSSSSLYEGQWEKNKRSGWGKMFCQNGDVYEGQWLEGKPNGTGTMQISNGNRYEGHMKDGKRHGYGRLIYTEKRKVYEGYWVDDMPKCGTMSEYDGNNAPTPVKYSIPPIELRNVQAVLNSGLSLILNKQTARNGCFSEESVRVSVTYDPKLNNRGTFQK